MEPIGVKPEQICEEKTCKEADCCHSREKSARTDLEKSIEKIQGEFDQAKRLTRNGAARTMLCTGFILDKAALALHSCGSFLRRKAPKVAAPK